MRLLSRSRDEPRRVWVQNVAVNASLLDARLEVMQARPTDDVAVRKRWRTGFVHSPTVR